MRAAIVKIRGRRLIHRVRQQVHRAKEIIWINEIFLLQFSDKLRLLAKTHFSAN
jgi:chorismate-pyruvate lyase